MKLNKTKYMELFNNYKSKYKSLEAFEQEFVNIINKARVSKEITLDIVDKIDVDRSDMAYLAGGVLFQENGVFDRGL